LINKILFVCSANKDRSKTAEDHFAGQFPHLEFMSAGTNQKLCEQYGTNFVSDELLDWADLIYVMEEKHRQFIRSAFKENYTQKLEVLKIEDVYTYNQRELINILEQKLNSKFLYP
jgi:predicted protein tyrosine phosphatase